MKAFTIKELKDAINNCPESNDDSPVYISVIRKDENGDEEGEIYALESFSVTMGGGYVSLVGYDGGMDEEDGANLL